MTWTALLSPIFLFTGTTESFPALGMTTRLLSGELPLVPPLLSLPVLPLDEEKSELEEEEDANRDGGFLSLLLGASDLVEIVAEYILGLERVQNFRVRAEPSLKFSSPSRAESKISESEPSLSLGYQ